MIAEPSATASVVAGARLGRPRDGAIDVALFAAIADLFTELPPAKITLRMLTARAGVTRDAFYRRYHSLGHFYVDLALNRYAVDLDFDTGSLREDLLIVQGEQAAMYGDLLARHLLPLMIAALGNDPSAAADFGERFLAPRRIATVHAFERAVARGEIPPVDDVESILDLLSGPLFFRASVPGLPPIDPTFVELTVDTVLAALRAGPDEA